MEVLISWALHMQQLMKSTGIFYMFPRFEPSNRKELLISFKSFGQVNRV